MLLGCALVGVTASNWLLLCTSTLALFLALAKRRSDVVAGIDDTLRPSLRGYNPKQSRDPHVQDGHADPSRCAFGLRCQLAEAYLRRIV